MCSMTLIPTQVKAIPIYFYFYSKKKNPSAVKELFFVEKKNYERDGNNLPVAVNPFFHAWILLAIDRLLCRSLLKCS